MFLGHYAVGFGAKKAAPEASLGTLFLAAQLADLLWPILVLAGVERIEIRPGATAVNPLVFTHYPWSHGLATLAVWGVLFALAHRLARRSRLRTAAVLAAVVVSHWALDAVSHVRDVPVGFSGPFVGLGLWRSLPATVAAELALLAAGVVLYVRATKPRDRTGTVALSALVAFLVFVYFASLFGPPPPNATAVALGAMGMWVIVIWAYWVDRHRSPTAADDPRTVRGPSGAETRA